MLGNVGGYSEKKKLNTRLKNHFSCCGICRRQCHYEFKRVFWKSCIVFCAKPKEVHTIKLISLQQIRALIALKYIINNRVLRWIKSGHRWLQHFLYLLPLYRSIGAIIHQPLSSDEVHPQICSSLRLLVLCLVRPDLSVIYYCLFIYYYFFFPEKLISFIGSLDKCHSSVFNALITFPHHFYLHYHYFSLKAPFLIRIFQMLFFLSLSLSVKSLSKFIRVYISA